MLAQPAQEGTLIPAPAELKADRVSKRGRALTLAVFAVVAALLLLTLLWIGGRRLNNFFVSRGDSYAQAQDYRAALSSYTWALRFDRGDAHSRLGRGYALRWLNDDEQALGEFGRYVALRPGDASGYLARAISKARLGRQSDALADFSAAIARDPASTAAYAGRARSRR